MRQTLKLNVPIAIGILAAASHAQPQIPGFEVASIRPHAGPISRIGDFSSSGPHLRLEGYGLRLLIMEAYDLKRHQLSDAGPASLSDQTYYNIAAKAEGDGSPTKAEFRRMLQVLLADRFKLKFHREMKEMSVYALVVGKSGPKFKESIADTPRAGNHSVNGRNQTMTVSQETMERLAEDIAIYVDRPVLDKTGLTGAYDIKLEATPEFRLRGEPQPRDISIFTAVQEQLGLKLEPQKGDVEVLVVDHIEKPSEN